MEFIPGLMYHTLQVRLNKHAADDCKYTPTNMNTQGNNLMQKWNSEPFKSGGYKTLKITLFNL